MKKTTVLAAVAAAMVIAPVAASAQTQICVINSKKLIDGSKAGKNMLDQLKSLGENESKSLEGDRESLKSKQSSLNEKTSGMTQEDLAADDALKTEIQSYAQKVGELQVKTEIAAREMIGTEAKARAEFNKAADAPVRAVMAAKGCGAMLERGATLLTLDEYDITDAVIAELDKTTTTIKVEKVELPTQQGG